ncbi:MAG: hypothetical protein HOY76_31355 [Streptomyces sp.]|nr:hypothetical protein [Streptomyces sp.]NUS15201.1 hypothetical protein [Streptomyces sp.]
MSRSIWDWFVVTIFKGEHIALLGPRSSGKTTLHRYILDTGETDAINPTLGPEKTTWNRQRELGLNIRKGADLPGGEANYADWHEQFAKSSRIFYLFDAHAARTVDAYEGVIRREGRNLRDWGTAGKHVMMLGTHSDEDPLAGRLGKAAYQDHIADIEAVAAFQTRAGVRGLAVGSLRTRDDAVALVKQALGTS